MCPLALELKSRPQAQVQVCVTGQHRRMLDPVLEAFHIVPDYDLAILKDGQTLFDITGAILEGLQEVLSSAKPDIVLVHGDTTTTFAAALACFYQHIPIGHVEAGLRTYRLEAPYPEEFNRQAVDIVSRWLFAPTETCRANLLREGKDRTGIYVTGNTAIDALKTTVREDFTHPLLDWAEDSRLLLVTAHRRENIGEPMRCMFRAIRRVVRAYPDVKAVYPVHLNPQVRRIACEELTDCERIRLTEPLDVIVFHNLMARSYLVLTDSGGLQEEAPSLGKPVLVMREVSERPEGVAAGGLALVGTEEQTIYDACCALLDSAAAYERMARAGNPYGDGTACRRIADILLAEEERGGKIDG